MFLNTSTLVSIVLFVICLIAQCHYFRDTRKYRKLFKNFFDKKKDYSAITFDEGQGEYPQIELVGNQDSDLNSLIYEINVYLFKTKGTSDYEFVRNKVERKLNMRYDQSTVYQSFPTYIGLMGTFLGVFSGILFFLFGFGEDGITDEAMKNLLNGVIVSMSTSLTGLLLTTINNSKAGAARKKIEDDKNEFYDFIQTDVTKTASASLVYAISKLHDTVDNFQPAFTTVIEGFKTAFNDCTNAFGNDFKEKVSAITKAVDVMGQNMDKINENIRIEKDLLDKMKSRDLVDGMENYIKAANHFVSITQSLNKFEEARRMMLAAAQEAIRIQQTYNDSLQIPREVATRIAAILDRIKTFEESLNRIGGQLNNRAILGDDIIKSIQEQIQGISRKGKIADRFLEMSDGKLQELYDKQTKVLETMNTNYSDAVDEHIKGFNNMIAEQTAELEKRHKDFIEELQKKFNIEEVRSEFSNLKALASIEQKIASLASSNLKQDDIHKEIAVLENQLKALKNDLSEINRNTKDGIKVSGFSLFR